MPNAIARRDLAPGQATFRNEYRWLLSRLRLKTVRDYFAQAMHACCPASLQ